MHEPAGLVEPAVDVGRADHRFERVGQDRRLVTAAGPLLAPAEPDERPEVELARGHLGQRAHLDNGGAQLRQLSLGQIGMAVEQRVRHDQAEHRVAQELKPLVGRQAAVLVCVRPVRKRALHGVSGHGHAESAEESRRVSRLGPIPVVTSSAHRRSRWLRTG